MNAIPAGYVETKKGVYERIDVIKKRLQHKLDIDNIPQIGYRQDMELWDKYQELGSVHKVGKLYGVHGQTVKNRLNAAGYKLNNAKWSEGEKQKVIEYYKNTPPKDFSAKKLAEDMGRTHAAVVIKASRYGCSDPRNASWKFSDQHKKNLSEAQKKRFERDGGEALVRPLKEYFDNGGKNGMLGKKHGDELRKNLSEKIKEWHKNNVHPRGMLGKKHTQEAKDNMSKNKIGKKVPRERVIRQLKTRLKRYGSLTPLKGRGTWRAAWREIGGKRKFYRSRWEANYARYLEFQKNQGLIKDWSHEPETFWFEGIKRGCVSYLPDFRVTNNDGSTEYHEVKGWMDAASKTKIKRMAKYHPSVVLKVFDGKWYSKNSRTLSNIIEGWEN
jgi:hypothetical protein